MTRSSRTVWTVIASDGEAIQGYGDNALNWRRLDFSEAFAKRSRQGNGAAPVRRRAQKAPSSAGTQPVDGRLADRKRSKSF
jgi:hypothetical protein